MGIPQDDITFIAQTNYHNRKNLIGIKQRDRLAHTYIVGKTGTGKSTLLETFIRQDIETGKGLSLLDPHGDLVERIVAHIPESRKSDLVYFNVSDTVHPLSFNPFEHVSLSKRQLAASGIIEVFKKLWESSWGPRLEHILRNAVLALVERSNSTLADVLRMLDDKEFRHQVALATANTQVRRFWLKEYESYPASHRIEAIAPIQNKVGAFLANPILNQILTQPKSSFNLRELMDGGKILLVNLAKGKIGEDTSSLLGSLLLTGISLAALSRSETPENHRRAFFVYADEFHTFTTLSIASMMSELRKFAVGMTVSSQYLSQVSPLVRDAIIGNVGTLICFRVGALDAELLEKEFTPEVTAIDLTSLPNHHIFLKLMVDGAVSRPFSAQTLKLSDR